MIAAGGRRSVLLALLLLLPAPAGGHEETRLPGVGTVVGRVRLAGPLPPRAAQGRREDPCAARAGAGPPAVVAGGGLPGAVVRLEGLGGGQRAGDAALDIEGCRLRPRVLAVAAGGRVSVRSSDDAVHHLRGMAGGVTVFNVALPLRGQVVDLTRRLGEPGIVRVRCAVHPGMEAWIVVHDGPYVAVTDGAGRFRISDVPAGTHRVSLWHEGVRPSTRGAGSGAPGTRPLTLSRTVTVVAGTDVEMDLALRARP